MSRLPIGSGHEDDDDMNVNDISGDGDNSMHKDVNEDIVIQDEDKHGKPEPATDSEDLGCTEKTQISYVTCSRLDQPLMFNTLRAVVQTRPRVQKHDGSVTYPKIYRRPESV